MKKIVSVVLIAIIGFMLISCEDRAILGDTYYNDFNKLTQSLDHVEIVQLSTRDADEPVIIRSFSYEESLFVIKDFCKIEYTIYYLAVLTTPKWVSGICLRIVRTDGGYNHYGKTDGAIGQCTNETDFDDFIAKYTT